MLFAASMVLGTAAIILRQAIIRDADALVWMMLIAARRSEPDVLRIAVVTVRGPGGRATESP